MNHPLQQGFDFKKETLRPAPSPAGYIYRDGSLFRSSDPGAPENGILVSHLPENSSEETAENFLRTRFSLWRVLEHYYANPLGSLTASRTMLLPHQVQAAVRVLEALRPRFLIADEVGLGKTIETGLIIKELLLKYNYKKALICVPAPLLYQWQAELKTKFNEDFSILTGPVLKKEPMFIQNHDRIIVSVDFAKDPSLRNRFLMKSFDIVVFDEAHRLRRDRSRSTKAYQFADEISSHCRCLLLLSATPFRGKIDEIYFLIRLIDPDILGPVYDFMNRYGEGGTDLQQRLAPVVLRRRKVDVGGFTKRFARTVKLTLSPEERAFYDATTDYVKREYNRAMNSGQRMKSFVMIVFQKLLDSSSQALIRALERRKERLEGVYFRLQSKTSESRALDFLHEIGETEELLDDFEEDEEILQSGPVFDPAETRNEIQSLNRLLQLGRRIRKDSKLEVMTRTLKQMRGSGHQKFLIFTQFKTTLEYLKSHLEKEFSVAVFHGGLSGRDKEKAIERFYENVDILILTEAGGEGRNLQVASALFNYDLPWSPLKIEQRIGRIHRFGQKKDVHVVNFASTDTVAERVLEVLEEKIRLFEDALGESDTLLGMLEDEINFESNFQMFLQEKKSKKEWDSEINRSLELARDNVGKLNRLFSPEFLDYNLNAFSKLKKSELPEEITAARNEAAASEKLLEKALSDAGYIEKCRGSRKRVFFSVPGADGLKSEKKIEGTFSHTEAEKDDTLQYLALGHSDIDSVVHHLLSVNDNRPVIRVASDRNGILFHLLSVIHADRPYKRFYSIFYNTDKKRIEPAPAEAVITSMNEPVYSDSEILSALEPVMAEVGNRSNEALAKINDRISEGIDYWRDNIQASYSAADQQYEEKLEIQKGKSKWYGERKMAGAISRTLNRRREEAKRVSGRLNELNISGYTVEVEVRYLSCFSNDRKFNKK